MNGTMSKKKKKEKLRTQKLKHEQFHFVMDFVFEKTQNNNKIRKMKGIAKLKTKNSKLVELFQKQTTTKKNACNCHRKIRTMIRYPNPSICNYLRLLYIRF